MKISEETLHLAGFALAHAAWSVSDLPEGDLLCPLAFVEEPNERKLLRFEAESQEQAIAHALATLEEKQSLGKAWAFAREGFTRKGNDKVDVLLIQVWAPGMTEPLFLSQPFEPFARRGKFRVMGKLEIINVAGSAEGHETITEIVREGIFQHPKVATLWRQWEATDAA